MRNEVLQISVNDVIVPVDEASNQWHIAHNVECRDLTPGGYRHATSI